MIVYKDSSEFVKQKNTVITVGTFDGLHRGHFKILEKLIDISKQINGTNVLLTFEPHPRAVLSSFELKILTTLEEKKEILEKAGVENLIVQNFNMEFSQMTSEQFIKDILIDQIGISHIIVGHDHKFGKDRLGDEEKLRKLGKQYNFGVTSVQSEKIEGEIISSTKIRAALAEGNIEKANLFLARNYSFTGYVVKGAQRGRTLGFPTANIQPDSLYKALPKNGVYAVYCNCAQEYFYGIMNIGYRPTFENKKEVVIEVHLLNFNKDIYGERLTVEIMRYLRDERKFETKEELIHQIETDKQIVNEIFLTHKSMTGS